MSNKELKDKMNILLEELSHSDNKNEDKKILAKAVQLGMNYQEQKIKSGIEIIFRELNK